MSDRVAIRDAAEDDFPAITDIYAHHVLHGLASFEEIPPDLDEMRRRYDALKGDHLPYLVAKKDGKIVGYAYAGPYRARVAYRYSLENSVYLADGQGGRGVGLKLLQTLIEACDNGKWRQMIAIIGDSGNSASIRVHEKAGFKQVGIFKDVGFKKGRWVDSVLMQRSLGAGGDSLPEA